MGPLAVGEIHVVSHLERDLEVRILPGLRCRRNQLISINNNFSCTFYQQQLQLYFQQQTAISQLTATVNKLQKSIESSDKRSQMHNIRCTPPIRSSTVTLADLSASDISDGSLSSDRDGSNSEDVLSVSSKRPRLNLEIRDCDGDQSKSKLDH